MTQLFSIPVILLTERSPLVVNTPSIPCILHALQHVEKFRLQNLKMHVILHDELRSHFF